MTVYFQGTEREDFVLNIATAVLVSTNTNYFISTNTRSAVDIKADSDLYWIDTASFSATDLWTHYVSYWDDTSNATPLYTVGFFEGTTPRIALRLVRGSYEIRYYSSSTWTTLLSTPSYTFTPENVRKTFDLRVKIGTVGTGEIRLYVDGVPVLSTKSFDTTFGGTCSAITSVRFNGGSTGSNGRVYLSEVICADYCTIGSRLVTITPNAAGTYNAWTGAGYTAVDEISPTADYMTSGTVNQRFSTGFSNMSALAAGEAITSVKVTGAFAKDLASPQSLNFFTRVSATDYDGSDQTAPSAVNDVSSIGQSWALNPATTAAWDVTAVNAAEFGIRSRT